MTGSGAGRENIVEPAPGVAEGGRSAVPWMRDWPSVPGSCSINALSRWSIKPRYSDMQGVGLVECVDTPSGDGPGWNRRNWSCSC
jgi:hypothetical protein